VRLDDLDKICAALNCTVADLMLAEPDAYRATPSQELPKAVGGTNSGAARPAPRAAGSSRRSLPPN
jgi:hypothetical protein